MNSKYFALALLSLVAFWLSLWHNSPFGVIVSFVLVTFFMFKGQE